MGRRVHVLPDKDSVSQFALRHLENLWREKEGLFRVALAGGSTPKQLYKMMAERDLPWERLELWWGDERFVDHDHKDSNYRMVKEALLDKVNIPEEQIHPWPIKKRASTSADHYEKKLRAVFDDEGPTFDLVLLGMGDDGHTASLFPDTAALEVEDRLAVANKVESLDCWRLTLTYPAIERAAQVLFMVSGEGKRKALNQVIQEAQLPSARVLCNGDTVFAVDRAAGIELTEPQRTLT